MALLFPLYWMFAGSLQDLGNLIRIPPNWIPKNITLQNYIIMGKISTKGIYYFGQGPNALLRWTFNTAVIFGLKCVIGVFLVTTAGYAFGVYRFKYKNVIFLIFIIGIFIGPGITIIPYYVTVKRLGLQGTWWGVILPFAYTPVGVYIFRNYVETIPSELIDAARIDGAGEFRILYKVMLPLCKPVIGVMVVLISLGTLQDYLWTLLMIPDTARQTLMVGVIQEALRANEISGGLNPIGLSLAGGVIIFMPLFLVFIFCQRYFIKGLTLGGVK